MQYFFYVLPWHCLKELAILSPYQTTSMQFINYLPSFFQQPFTFLFSAFLIHQSSLVPTSNSCLSVVRNQSVQRANRINQSTSFERRHPFVDALINKLLTTEDMGRDVSLNLFEPVTTYTWSFRFRSSDIAFPSVFIRSIYHITFPNETKINDNNILNYGVFMWGSIFFSVYPMV